MYVNMLADSLGPGGRGFFYFLGLPWVVIFVIRSHCTVSRTIKLIFNLIFLFQIFYFCF